MSELATCQILQNMQNKWMAAYDHRNIVSYLPQLAVQLAVRKGSSGTSRASVFTLLSQELWAGAGQG